MNPADEGFIPLYILPPAVPGCMAAVSVMSDDAELARLVTLVAHELRTPLSVVSGYVKMLAGERQGPLTEAQRRSVAGADRACQQMMGLAADVSWLARIARGEVAPNRAPVALERLLADIQAAHASPDEHPVTVEAIVETKPLTIHADAIHLRRALTSMLAAAVRGAPDHAVVRLVAGRRDAATPPQPVIAIACGPADAVGDLLAADPHTLDPLDEALGGLGVGLPLARRLMALEGGTIGTRATPGGLGLLLTLPG
jgi:signal transduction histidine kinase